MAEVTGTAAAQQPAPGLFLRQSSGLVREISILAAFFFNVAAFMGPFLPGGLNYAITAEPMWTFLGLSAYAWGAIAVGVVSILIAFIFASMNSVMPRTGGDYVFTSRILSPIAAWIESWAIVWVSLGLIGFCLVLLLIEIRNLGIQFRYSFPHTAFWAGADGWLASKGSTFIAGTVVMLLACAFAVLRPRAFFRALAWLAGLSLVAMTLLVICILAFVHKPAFLATLPHYTGGVTSQGIIHMANYPAGGFTFIGFMVICNVVLGSYIGFQYSAYLGGEVAGGVRRSVLIAVLGSLAAAVLLNSLINDLVARKFGIPLMASYGTLFFTGNLPGGLPPFSPVLATIVRPGLWPVWVLSMGSTVVFTFLLIPVYMVFVSRTFLAWALDRQAPAWLGEVNERTNTPVNAVITAAVVGEVILYLNTYRGVALTTTLWFGAGLLGIALVMPGLNAMLAKRRRPDLFATAPYGNRLPIMGAIWAGSMALIYVFGVGRPMIQGLLRASSRLQYFRSSGILAGLVVLLFGFVVYYVNLAWNRSKGIDRKRLFTQIPPD